MYLLSYIVQASIVHVINVTTSPSPTTRKHFTSIFFHTNIVHSKLRDRLIINMCVYLRSEFFVVIMMSGTISA